MWTLLILLEGKKIAKGSLVRVDKLEARVQEKSKETRKKKRKNEPILPHKKEPLSKGFVRKSRKGYKMASALIDASADFTRAATNTINRAIKSWLSSDFEKLLLSLTSPDDIKPLGKDLREFLATIGTFALDKDLSPLNENNPYRICLRKAYAKMAEPDERTSLKGVFLFHLLLRSVTKEDALLYQKLFKKMKKERVFGGGKNKSTYFDIELVADCTSDTAYLAGFTERYADYVFKRCTFFTCQFDELSGIDKYNMLTKDIMAQLFNAIKLLESALKCAPEGNDAEEDCELVYTTALDLVARDVKTLFEIYHKKLTWVLREAEIGDIFDSVEYIGKEEDVTAMLAMFKRFYADTYPRLAAFLTDVQEVTSLYRPRNYKKGKKAGAEEVSLALECPPSFPVTPARAPQQQQAPEAEGSQVVEIEESESDTPPSL